MRKAGGFSIPPDHPCLEGHFPGRPVVPGVVLLDAALDQIRAATGAGPPLLLARVKFSTPVLPGQHVEVAYEERAGDGHIGFACRIEGAIAASGVVSFAAALSRP